MKPQPNAPASTWTGRSPALLLVLAVMLLAVPGCFVVNRVGMALLYDGVRLPDSLVVRDLAYQDDDDDKHRLDLYLPPGTTGFSTVVFVHGGGWDSGDRAFRFGGKDIYGNIGRYLAAHGIGAAVISYRLLPEVQWPAQIDDVAAATAWVYRHIGDYGGDPGALFLMGHSAGAQLAARVALDEAALMRQGIAPGIVCGVLAVSGAAYDLTDQTTYDLGASHAYMERRFSNTGADWETAASVTGFIDPTDPPFLILYAGNEALGFHRQASLLHARLRAHNIPARLLVVPRTSHAGEILTLSRDDKTAGPATLDFLRSTSCGR